MSIRAELTLGISNFQANLERATQEVRRKSGEMKAATRGIGREGGGLLGGIGSGVAGLGTDLLGAAGLAGGAMGVGMAIKGTLDYADDLADLTLKLQDSAEALQKVDYAAKLAGAGGVEQVGNAMIKLEKALGDVENKKAAEALANLGLTAESLAAMSLDEKMVALSEAFQEARESGTGVNDIQALMGRSAAELIPLLEQGGDALRGMFADAPVLAEETVQEMARINDELDAMILKSKSFAVGTVGAIGGLGRFAANMGLDGSVGGLLALLADPMGQFDAALLAEADAGIADAQAAAERNRRREEQGKAQQRAAEEAAKAAERAKADEAEKAANAEADKAEEQIVRDRERRRLENDRALERADQMRFAMLSPQEQMLALRERLAETLGGAGSRDAILTSIDELRARGQGAAAVQALEDFNQLEMLAARTKGVAAEGQGSFATLMDQIFGRGTAEQQLDEMRQANQTARDQKTALEEILRKMDDPPPTSRFTDFGL